MTDTIAVGARGEQVATVTNSDTAIAMGSGDVPVLATPRVIAWMEAAAVAALSPTLARDMTTVGTVISVEHLVASPVGSSVLAVAEVTDVQARRVTFRLTALAGDEVVARGTHTRVVVDRSRFQARLEATGD